jgi:hypothetical protein
MLFKNLSTGLLFTGSSKEMRVQIQRKDQLNNAAMSLLSGDIPSVLLIQHRGGSDFSTNFRVGENLSFQLVAENARGQDANWQRLKSEAIAAFKLRFPGSTGSAARLAGSATGGACGSKRRRDGSDVSASAAVSKATKRPRRKCAAADDDNAAAPDNAAAADNDDDDDGKCESEEDSCGWESGDSEW